MYFLLSGPKQRQQLKGKSAIKPCDHNPGQWMAKRAQWKQTAEGRGEKSKSISAASCRRSQNSHKFRAFLTRSRRQMGNVKGKR